MRVIIIKNPGIIIGTNGKTIRLIESHTHTNIKHHSSGPDEYIFNIEADQPKDAQARTNSINTAISIMRYLDSNPVNHSTISDVLERYPLPAGGDNGIDGKIPDPVRTLEIL